MQAFTDEQRDKAIRAAKEKRELGKALYKTDFLDNEHWLVMAQHFGVLLPKWHVAPDVTKMRRWIRSLGITEREYCEACGEGWRLDDFAKINPNWPLRAFVGILLEYAYALNNAREINKKHTHK